MSRIDQIAQSRQQKLERLRERGVSPYPNSFHRTHAAAEAIALLEKQSAETPEKPGVTVAGRIMANRAMGKISFLDLRDSSGKIQLFLNTKNLSEAQLELLKDLDIGDIIGASGGVFRTRTNEPTIEVKDFTVLAKSLQPLPEKWHGLADVDKRQRQRYIDLIANTEVADVFRTRSKIITAVRQFLNERGFTEVETPVLQPAAGGALAKPFITHHNALDQEFYLRIALELHLKRLIVGGLDKVYELGRVFRNEGISTKHNPEFTMLESYEAYADYHDVMAMTEQMISGVCRQVLGTTEVKWGDHTIDFKSPWPRLSLHEAVKEYSGIDFVKYPRAEALRGVMQEKGIQPDLNKNWAKLVDELVSTFVEPKLIQPTFLTDYPASMSPLAKSKPGEERVVERFEAIAGCMEIANAFTELNDPLEQRQRFEDQLKERQGEGEEKWTIDEDFLTALEYGMPPTGGLGVGIDRLVMLLTNQQSIREVILFPAMREKPQEEAQLKSTDEPKN
ncbi:MAG: lysine--tRNA ligase [Dehalococcoidales bacterium]|nr:lysine--tRNA ligase [Dehalococcoidales bacterium]